MKRAISLFVVGMLATLELQAGVTYETVCPASFFKIPVKPSAFTSDFTVMDSGNTVLDTRTGLMWMRCELGRSYNDFLGSCNNESNATTGDWNAALNEVSNVNTGGVGVNFGYADWRLPNIKELMSIVEHQCAFPSINTQVFPGAMDDLIWSSTRTQKIADPGVIRVADFANGVATGADFDAVSMSSAPIYIRMVREYTP